MRHEALSAPFRSAAAPFRSAAAAAAAASRLPPYPHTAARSDAPPPCKQTVGNDRAVFIGRQRGSVIAPCIAQQLWRTASRLVPVSDAEQSKQILFWEILVIFNELKGLVLRNFHATGHKK